MATSDGQALSHWDLLLSLGIAPKVAALVALSAAVAQEERAT